jgi:hypothetical protein
MTEIGTETYKTVKNLVSLPGWYHYPMHNPICRRRYDFIQNCFRSLRLSTSFDHPQFKSRPRTLERMGHRNYSFWHSFRNSCSQREEVLAGATVESFDLDRHACDRVILNWNTLSYLYSSIATLPPLIAIWESHFVGLSFAKYCQGWQLRCRQLSTATKDQRFHNSHWFIKLVRQEDVTVMEVTWKTGRIIIQYGSKLFWGVNRPLSRMGT